MFEMFVQAGLFILGATCVFLTQCRPALGRWACIVGMISEPFWFYTAYEHRQWGITVLACWYTFTWGKGIYMHWVLPYRARVRHCCGPRCKHMPSDRI